MTGPLILWFRRDLRIDDNPALIAAAASGRPVLPLYILDDVTPGKWALGGAARWWLHHSLERLAASLAGYGLKLVLKCGAAAAVLDSLIAETGAEAVFWNRLYEPWAIARDTKIKAGLLKRNVDVQSFNGSLLCEPWEIKTKTDGGSFKVFTPFWRACQEFGIDAETHRPPATIASGGAVASDQLVSWKLLPGKPDWASKFPEHWEPGEAGAKKRLAAFLDDSLKGYGVGRDRPAQANTSGLSPHLQFGEIGPRQVVRAVRAATAERAGIESEAAKFLSEIGWREFCHHLLFHMPTLPQENFRPEFDAFPWSDPEPHLTAWKKGQTGIPLVDAGMRQLWQTGWMHNRVRMVVASFLVKHLLIDWRHGADWFWDTLCDADIANNSANWQWVAGCGADAAPYFRIFNPVLQGEKFDPQGGYIRRFVPELGRLPDKWLGKPWEASEAVLAAAGVKLGRDYPTPIVDLRRGRDRALAAFAKVRKAA